MSTQPGKRTAYIKVTLNKRNVESLKSAEKPFIAWDDKLTASAFESNPPAFAPISSTTVSATAGEKPPTGAWS